MIQPKDQTDALLFGLLRQWGEALLRLQADLPGQPALDGGILCPACKMIHGRCHEAAYPLMALARRTGDRRFLTGAKKLLRWSEAMLCPDGSMKNDAKSDWRGVTVFAAVSLHDALFYHGDLLAAEEKARCEARLAAMGAWLFRHLRPGGLQAYLNYYAANACAMALLGKYFGKPEYTALARELISFCLAHTTENGLIYGEGHPLDLCTPKGCRAVDAGGYNVEETLPSLTRCAGALGDRALLDRCRALWAAHLRWMLPDGAWDNSEGTRAFKWTYYGSRTADGAQDALFALGRVTPVFAEAALRNTLLLRRCTVDGLLTGGPDYGAHGEAPCVHHTFCRMKALAGSLEGGLYDFERCPLPADAGDGAVKFPELDVVRVACGGWRADVSGYDCVNMPGAHASGGALSLLWHETYGPLIACGAADYRIREPFNQQLPRDPESHLSPCPRLETEAQGKRFRQDYDLRAAIDAHTDGGSVTVTARFALCDETGMRLPESAGCELRYRFTPEALVISGSVPKDLQTARFVLPLIGCVRPAILRGSLCGEPRPFFNLSPGFQGTEYRIRPDQNGRFEIGIVGKDCVLRDER